MTDQKKQPQGEKIDIIAEAYETARRDSALTYAGALKVLAPAKVNLHLAVGDRREDGYHQVVNVMHALTLHDVVYVRFAMEPPVAGAGLQVRSTCVGFEGIQVPQIDSADNLTTRAILALGDALGLSGQDASIEVRVEKHVPHQAGLGGGSSDAAAALVAAAKLWGVPADDARVEAVAARLGADVAFFLKGGCVRMGGIGERFDATLEPAKTSVVLVKPEGGLSTAGVYQAFDQDPQFASPQLAAAVEQATSADALIAAMAAGEDAAGQTSGLFNNLAPAAESLQPELADVRGWLQQQPGVTSVLLCGSGSCTFALCDSFAAASTVATEAKKQGWWSRACALSSLRAAVVPAR